MSGQPIGYIRVSTLDQHTERQLDGIEADKTFTDKASGIFTVCPCWDDGLAIVLSATVCNWTRRKETCQETRNTCKHCKNQLRCYVASKE